MAPFPESATPGLVLGYGLAIALVIARLIGLAMRYWPRKGR